MIEIPKKKLFREKRKKLNILNKKGSVKHKFFIRKFMFYTKLLEFGNMEDYYEKRNTSCE